MITITQECEDENEARKALSWRRYDAALGRIRDEVRRVVKYSDKKPEDKVEIIYQIIWDELNDAGWDEV
jgi:hypothetical protein